MSNFYRKRSGVSLDEGTTGTNSSRLLSPPRTPSPTPDTATESNQPSTKDFDLAVLKSLLNPKDGRCGCLTKLEKPCKMKTPKKNETKMDCLIESMVASTQSSPELEGSLQSLAKLVHCHFHDGKKCIESRVEKWIFIFPTGDPTAKPFILLERQVKTALRCDYTHCIEKTEKQEDCRSKLNGQEVQNCTKTVNKIIKSVVDLEDTEFEYLLKVLAYNGLCDHHQNQCSKHVQLWKLRIMEIRSTYQAESLKLVDDCTPDSVGISDETSHDQKVQSSMLKSSTKNDLENQVVSIPIDLISSPPADYWPKAYDESPFEIIERSDRLQDRESSYTEIKANATRRLNEKSGDLKNGFIYLYTVKGNEEFVKLGYTIRSPDERYKEWELSCNRVPKPLYEDAISVPNAHRVEALCHAELDYCRRRVDCTGCLKQHIEWFEIAPREAISVIQKWSKWMASHPYIKTWSYSGVQWVLKPEEMKKCDDIDTFMKDLSSSMNEPKH
ncbi:hypothetical protein ACHAQJ_001270 [Trichoderma viride]